MKRRIAGLILVMCMVLLLLPGKVSAEENSEGISFSPGKICPRGPVTLTFSMESGLKSSAYCVTLNGTYSTHVVRFGQHYDIYFSEELIQSMNLSGTAELRINAYSADNPADDPDVYLRSLTVQLEVGHSDGDKNHKCDSCGEKMSDCADLDKNHLCDVCGATLSSHSGSGANCKEGALCDTCGERFGEPDTNNHTGSGTWGIKTETQHEYRWSCCGKPIISLERHHWENGVCKECDYVCGHIGGTANCKELAVCTVCGLQYGVLDKTNHAFETEVREKRPALCTADGYTGDTYCLGCGEKIASGDVLPKLDHDYTCSVVKEPSYTEMGLKMYSCQCGDTYVEEIPMLEINYPADNPQTGDSSRLALWAVVFLVTAGLLTITGIYGKKKLLKA